LYIDACSTAGPTFIIYERYEDNREELFSIEPNHDGKPIE